MELRQLEYLVAVADHGGFTRAAAALHVAQPSLSDAIRRLEVDLGVTLFDRRGRRVRLTSAGEDVLGPARATLREVHRLRSAVGGHTGLEAGTLELVALPSLVDQPVAGWIGELRRRAPGIVVRVAEPRSLRELERMVRDGRCEIGVTELADTAPGSLSQRPIGSQPLLAVLPPGSDEVDASLPVAGLAGWPLVISPPGTSIRDHVDAALAAAGVAATIAVETHQREALVPLVLAGAGATVLPDAAARAAARAGAHVAELVPRLERRLAVLHPPAGLSPAAVAFLDVIGVEPAPR